MTYHTLAVDYDGTLAQDGRVDADTINALERWKATGRQIMLVTGRRIAPLLEVFPQIELCDSVVAENGALLYDPQTGEEELLAEPASETFVAELKRQGMQRVYVGRVIVAAWRPDDAIIRQVIEEQQQLSLEIIYNKDAVMVLPGGISKVHGLRFAAERLGVSLKLIVGAGDAENDSCFLQACGLSAAVANALPEIRGLAKINLSQPRGAGICELIDSLLASNLE